MARGFERPEARQVNAAIREMTALARDMSGVTADGAAVKESIAGEAEALRRRAALEELSRIDVETLNADKQGIRVSALRGVGIENIGQLCGMSTARITAINGIGEKSAKRIRQIVDSMQRAVAASAQFRIDARRRDAHQERLVRGLYILRNGEAARTRLGEMLKNEPDISAALADARHASGFFRWLFLPGRRKEQAIRAYERLSALLSGAFAREAGRLLRDYEEIERATTSAIYADFERNAVSYYTLLERLGLGASATPATGLPEDLVAEIEQYPLNTDLMKAELRRYQIFGAKYILRQQKALLGDEMGLGKTIQALAALCDLKSRGETHFLVVCPASVLMNWKRETDKHTAIPSIIIHGWDKEEEFEDWKRDGGVGITNYESLLKLADKLDFHFGALVVDEAHFVKNPEAQRTKALIACARRTERILYMTGTPLENRVEEMCFLVGCLRPDIARSLSRMKTLHQAQPFKRELAPIYLRRVRDDVLTELPDLIENEDWLEPSRAELSAYADAVRSGNFMAMRRVSWDVEPSASNKAQRLRELCEEARDEGRKVIVFSFFRETLRRVCELAGEQALGPITGGVSSEARQQMIDEFAASKSGRVLVAQVQAGGVGLNIQAASVVIFCEPQIKPSLETQAISRAYRMGQVRDVQVHRLLCVDTVDERMMEMLRGKQAEFDAYADESVIGAQSLREQADSAWIRSLIEQERARLDAQDRAVSCSG